MNYFEKLIDYAETVKTTKDKKNNTNLKAWRDSDVEERLSYALIKGIVDYIDIVDVWKNYYLITDYQGYHTHSNTMWSFIINHSVEETKTQFFNPYIADIQNQTPLHNSKDMPTIYMPKLKRGQMILFPSWVAHQVLAGNTGITISGNVKCMVQRHHRI